MRTLATLVFASIFVVVSACTDERKVSISEIHSDLQHISAALKLYRLDCGNYPSEELGLAILVEAGDDNCDSRLEAYISGVSNDPWGNPYLYRQLSDNQFELVSLGRDGREGGQGNSKDIRLID